MSQTQGECSYNNKFIDVSIEHSLELLILSYHLWLLFLIIFPVYTCSFYSRSFEFRYVTSTTSAHVHVRS